MGNPLRANVAIKSDAETEGLRSLARIALNACNASS